MTVTCKARSRAAGTWLDMAAQGETPPKALRSLLKSYRRRHGHRLELGEWQPVFFVRGPDGRMIEVWEDAGRVMGRADRARILQPSRRIIPARRMPR